MFKRLSLPVVNTVVGRRNLHLSRANTTGAMELPVLKFPTKLTTPNVSKIPTRFIRMPTLDNDYLLQPNASKMILFANDPIVAPRFINADMFNTLNIHRDVVPLGMDQEVEGLQMTSILRKRKLKMNRHRHAKRQRALRFLSVKKRHRA